MSHSADTLHNVGEILVKTNEGRAIRISDAKIQGTNPGRCDVSEENIYLFRVRDDARNMPRDIVGRDHHPGATEPSTTTKGRFRNIEDGLNSCVSSDAKSRIDKILGDIGNLSDVEKLLLYLKLPTGAIPQDDQIKQTPTSGLHASSRVEQDQALAWIQSHLEEDSEICLAKQDVYDDYRVYCDVHSLKPLNTADFGKVMKGVFPNIKPRRLGQRGQSKYCYGGLRKKLEVQPPYLPDLELSTNKEKCRSSEDEFVMASCLLVCEWAQKLLEKTFPSIRELASHLVENLYVNNKSMAAFTVIASLPEPGLSSSKAPLMSLLTNTTGGNRHRETQLQLQRKLQEREMLKEQRLKLRQLKTNNEQELMKTSPPVRTLSSNTHETNIKGMDMETHETNIKGSDKVTLQATIKSSDKEIHEITIKRTDMENQSAISGTLKGMLFSETSSKSSSASDTKSSSDVDCSPLVDKEESDADSQTFVLESPRNLYTPVSGNFPSSYKWDLKDAGPVGVQFQKAKRLSFDSDNSMDSYRSDTEPDYFITSPLRNLTAKSFTEISTNPPKDSCKQHHVIRKPCVVSGLNLNRYTVKVSPEKNVREYKADSDKVEVKHSHTVIVEMSSATRTTSIARPSAFVPFSQTVKDENTDCELINDASSIDIKFRPAHKNLQPVLNIDSKPNENKSICILNGTEDSLGSLPCNFVPGKTDTIKSSQQAGNISQKTRLRATPSKPKPIQPKTVSSLLREHRGSVNSDGIDYGRKPVAAILKEKRARDVWHNIGQNQPLSSDILTLQCPRSGNTNEVFILLSPNSSAMSNTSNTMILSPGNGTIISTRPHQNSADVPLVAMLSSGSASSTVAMATPTSCKSTAKKVTSFGLQAIRPALSSQEVTNSCQRNTSQGSNTTLCTAFNGFSNSVLTSSSQAIAATISQLEKLREAGATPTKMAKYDRNMEASSCRKRKSKGENPSSQRSKKLNFDVKDKIDNNFDGKDTRRSKSCTFSDKGSKVVRYRSMDSQVPDISVLETDALLDSDPVSVDPDLVCSSSIDPFGKTSSRLVQTSSKASRFAKSVKMSRKHFLKDSQKLSKKIDFMLKKSIAKPSKASTAGKDKKGLNSGVASSEGGDVCAEFINKGNYKTEKAMPSDKQMKVLPQMLSVVKQDNLPATKVDVLPVNDANTKIPQSLCESDSSKNFESSISILCEIAEGELPSDVADFITESMTCRSASNPDVFDDENPDPLLPNFNLDLENSLEVTGDVADGVKRMQLTEAHNSAMVSDGEEGMKENNYEEDDFSANVTGNVTHSVTVGSIPIQLSNVAKPKEQINLYVKQDIKSTQHHINHTDLAEDIQWENKPQLINSSSSDYEKVLPKFKCRQNGDNLRHILSGEVKKSNISTAKTSEQHGQLRSILPTSQSWHSKQNQQPLSSASHLNKQIQIRPNTDNITLSALLKQSETERHQNKISLRPLSVMTQSPVGVVDRSLLTPSPQEGEIYSVSALHTSIDKNPDLAKSMQRVLSTPSPQEGETIALLTTSPFTIPINPPLNNKMHAVRNILPRKQNVLVNRSSSLPLLASPKKNVHAPLHVITTEAVSPKKQIQLVTDDSGQFVSPTKQPLRRQRATSMDRVSASTPTSDAGYHSYEASPILASTPVSLRNINSASRSYSPLSCGSETFTNSSVMASDSSMNVGNDVTMNSHRMQSDLLLTVANNAGKMSQNIASSDDSIQLPSSPYHISDLNSSISLVSSSAFVPIQGNLYAMKNYVAPVKPMVTIGSNVSQSIAHCPPALFQISSIDSSFGEVDDNSDDHKSSGTLPSYQDAMQLLLNKETKQSDPIYALSNRAADDFVSDVVAIRNPDSLPNTTNEDIQISAEQNNKELDLILEKLEHETQHTSVSQAFPFSYQLSLLRDKTVVTAKAGNDDSAILIPKQVSEVGKQRSSSLDMSNESVPTDDHELPSQVLTNGNVPSVDMRLGSIEIANRNLSSNDLESGAFKLSNENVPSTELGTESVQLSNESLHFVGNRQHFLNMNPASEPEVSLSLQNASLLPGCVEKCVDLPSMNFTGSAPNVQINSFSLLEQTSSHILRQRKIEHYLSVDEDNLPLLIDSEPQMLKDVKDIDSEPPQRLYDHPSTIINWQVNLDDVPTPSLEKISNLDDHGGQSNNVQYDHHLCMPTDCVSLDEPLYDIEFLASYSSDYSQLHGPKELLNGISSRK